MKTLNVVQVFDRVEQSAVDPTRNISRYNYKVMRVTNSIVPNILDLLTGPELDDYCESENWEVTIK